VLPNVNYWLTASPSAYLLGTLAYTFAGIGDVVNLKVEDYYPSGKRLICRCMAQIG